MRSWPSILALAFILGSCSSMQLLYRPESAGGKSGYAEQRLSGNRFLITYTAPQRSPVAAADFLALWRTADFALASGYRGFLILDRTVSRDVYVLPQAAGTRATYRGGYREWRAWWRAYCRGKRWRGCDTDPLAPSAEKLRPRVEVGYIVLLTNATEGPVIDARALLATLSKDKPRSVELGSRARR